MATWLPLGAYMAAVISAIVPWVNAEALLLSTIALTRPSPGMSALLVAAVALGQMTGKGIIYWMSRLGGRPSIDRMAQGRFGGRVSKWCDACVAYPVRTQGLILTSAVFGIPPFYLVSVAAGAVKVSFTRFLAIGLAGRTAHFAAIALLPGLLRP